MSNINQNENKPPFDLEKIRACFRKCVDACRPQHVAETFRNLKNRKWSVHDFADAFRNAIKKLVETSPAFAATKKAMEGRRKSAAVPAFICDFLLWILAGFHKIIATIFLTVFRSIGYGLSFIPWGARYAIAFAIAVLIIFQLYTNGTSTFLLTNRSELESFADRNPNKLDFNASDMGMYMTARLYAPSEKQKKLVNQLIELQSKSEAGDAPTKQQLEILSETVGVPYVYLEQAFTLSVQANKEKLIVTLNMEKLDGSQSAYSQTIEDPAPEQLKAKDYFAAGGRFMQAQIPELNKLLPGLDGKKVKFKEVIGVKVEHYEPFLFIQANLQPMTNDEIEEVQNGFDERNTVYIPPRRQYRAFINADTQTVVSSQIEAANEKNRELARREEEKIKADLNAKAEAEIAAYKASHGRITEKDKKDIRQRFDEQFKPVPVLTVDKTTLKSSTISNWYQERFNKSKFVINNLRFEPSLLEILYDNQLTKPLERYLDKPALAVMGLLLLGIICGIISIFVKPLRRPVYYVLLAAGAAFTLYWLYLISLLFNLPDSLLNVVTKKEIFSSDQRNEMWFDYLWFWCPAAFYSFFLWFPLLTTSAKTYFNVPLKKREVGELIAQNLECKGKNPGIYRSFYWVLAYHFFILLVLPVLLKSCYGLDEYTIPKGDGGGQIAPTQVKKIKKKKKPKKRLVLNPNSAFIFAMPDIPDEELVQDLDEQTSEQYTATGGTFGSGKKSGGKPGWPNGMDNGVIRFIRLKYAGGDWDQDMGKGADYNMLIKIKEYAGFNIAPDTEFITVDELENRFRNKKKKPPFVYITGRGGINMTTKEVKQLRKYLLEDGGLLFADNGGGSFNSSFRNLVKRVLPNHEMVDIANDDIIYQQPFYFPNGAPRLWHHSGDRALGVKNSGRWIVFYHQGDINDAWKTGGSGVSAQQQSEAYKMGANVIAYAFGEYLKSVYGDAL